MAFYFDPREYFWDEFVARHMVLSDFPSIVWEWYENKDATMTPAVAHAIALNFGTSDEVWLRMDEYWQKRPMHPRRRLLKIMRDTEALIHDIEWWNRHRADRPPFDCEGDRVLLDKCKKAMAAFEARDMEQFGKMHGEIISQAMANVGGGISFSQE